MTRYSNLQGKIRKFWEGLRLFAASWWASFLHDEVNLTRDFLCAGALFVFAVCFAFIILAMF